MSAPAAPAQLLVDRDGDYTPSPTHTVVDYDAAINPIPKSRTASATTLSTTDKPRDPSPSLTTGTDTDGTGNEKSTDSAPALTQRKKWALLMVFSLGFFVDIWMYSAFCKCPGLHMRL